MFGAQHGPVPPDRAIGGAQHVGDLRRAPAFLYEAIDAAASLVGVQLCGRQPAFGQGLDEVVNGTMLGGVFGVHGEGKCVRHGETPEVEE